MNNPIIHGMCHTPEYHAWEGMKTRCAAGEESIHYSRYKARGIKVCERWANSFIAFYEDVGPRPSPLHSIDRIDNNGNYEPANVRWATRTVQQRNTRATSFVTIDGVTRSVREWDDIAGLRAGTVKTRLQRDWPKERLLQPRDPIRVQSGLKRWGKWED